MLKRLLKEVQSAPPDTSDGVATAAKFAIGLLLPRFAGTMLKLLYDAKVPLRGTDLMESAARFQGVNATDREIGFRLAVALDYLRRTGCVSVTGSMIRVEDFGREVYETRFEKTR